MAMNLDVKAWLSLAGLAVVLGLLLFFPAGTIFYWQAWIYLFTFMSASTLITIYLMRHDRALLQRRMRGGPFAEKRATEKFIMVCTSIGFIALLVVPALDFQHAWSRVPIFGIVIGDMLVVVGFYFIFLVYRENPFTSATIEISEGQRVVSTGPYAIVRHPMYASSMLYMLGTPLALGSYWGVVAFGAIVPFLLWRIYDEENLLEKNLPGYLEYQSRVRYRLVPLVW
jgi:protein-S-isoprenylcysteine O-methyltransferase Ste14